MKHPDHTEAPAPAGVTSTKPLPTAGGATLSVLDSQSVLQGRHSVAIEHNGAVYRLQTTRQGKLILTK